MQVSKYTITVFYFKIASYHDGHGQLKQMIDRSQSSVYKLGLPHRNAVTTHPYQKKNGVNVNRSSILNENLD